MKSGRGIVGVVVVQRPHGGVVVLVAGWGDGGDGCAIALLGPPHPPPPPLPLVQFHRGQSLLGPLPFVCDAVEALDGIIQPENNHPAAVTAFGAAPSTAWQY